MENSPCCRNRSAQSKVKGTKILFWQRGVGDCFDVALLCQKHPTRLLDLGFAGSLEQVAVSCVLSALKGKEEGAYGQSGPRRKILRRSQA